MTDFVIILFAFLVTFTIIARILNRIPKEGRCIYVTGEPTDAIILNENRTAEKPVTMKLMDANGKKYRVKLKPDESKMWVKGDTVQIKFSEDKKNYRVLFNDYFRENESRMRENAVERIKQKANPYLFATRLTGFKKDDAELLLNSNADSLTLFSFFTYLGRINTFCVISAIMTVLFLSWNTVVMPPLSQMALPLILLAVSYSVIYSTVMSCKRILKKYVQ